MNKKQKSLSKWLTYEEVQAKSEYMALFNMYFRPYDENWLDKVPEKIINRMKYLRIKAGDAFPKIKNNQK